jgi:hypothetical protein
MYRKLAKTAIAAFSGIAALCLGSVPAALASPGHPELQHPHGGRHRRSRPHRGRHELHVTMIANAAADQGGVYDQDGDPGTLRDSAVWGSRCVSGI